MSRGHSPWCDGLSHINTHIGGIITHSFLRASLHGGGGPQIGEVTCTWPGHPTYHVYVIKLKMRLYGQVGYPTKAGYLTYLGSPTSM